MALFGRKKKAAEEPTQEAEAAVEKAPAAQPTQPPVRDLSRVLIKPRITEKAVSGIEKNIYTFEVPQDATKYDVRDAVRAIYEVTPRKIRMVTKKPRKERSRLRGRTIAHTGEKKAYVYLKEGDRIDLV